MKSPRRRWHPLWALPLVSWLGGCSPAPGDDSSPSATAAPTLSQATPSQEPTAAATPTPGEEPTPPPPSPTPRPDTPSPTAPGPTDGPTPTSAEPTPTSPAPPPSGVRINEVGCNGEDFIELVSGAAQATDLGGWSVSDNPADPSHVYTFPAGSALPPGGWLVVKQASQEGEGAAGADGLPFGLKCGSDSIYLLDPDGGIVDQLVLPEVYDANSWGRLPDLSGPWTDTRPTPGEANLPPEPVDPDPAGPLFDPFKVVDVDLSLPQSSVDALYADPYTYVPGTFQLTDESGASEVLDVGVRIKGRLGSLRTLDGKAALKVKFDFEDNDQRFMGLKKLTLNNMVQDPSMIHEVLSYEIFRGFGVASPRVGYAWVRINGADYGLYANVESPDDVFLGRWFPTTQHLYEGAYGTDAWPGHEPWFEVGEGDEDDRSDLTSLADANATHEGEAWFSAATPLLRMEQATRMWVIENYIGHWDGYAPTINNYYLHSEDDGRFSMMPWGTDQTFAAWLTYHDGGGILFRRCMGSVSCRTIYDEQLIALLPLIDSLKLPGLAGELSDFLMPWIEADPRKEYSTDDVEAWVDATIAFMRLRRADAAELVNCLENPLTDTDGDGYKCDTDCGEGDSSVHPGATETCGDGIDQDCNGAVDDSPECPDCHEAWAGEHRYLYCTYPRTFDDAHLHCQLYGSELAKVDSVGENTFIMQQMNQLIGARDAWMGLDDRSSEGTFRWWDGSPLLWSNWAPGEPNNAGEEDCGHFWSDGSWNDIPCGAGLAVVCEDTCAPGQDDDQDGYLACETDCDDTDPDAHPGAPELCEDGKDQDCSGIPDDDPSCVPAAERECEEVEVGDFSGSVCTHTATWWQAQAECEETGQVLAWFASEDEQLRAVEAAFAQVGERELWFGLQDQKDEGEYYWTDGSPPLYIRWADNQPNNGSGSGEQDCVRLHTDGKWNDTVCEAAYNYICRAK